ncbi:MAG: FHA domain-containing protein [Anaerolineaceae bacterium]|nr:FHA domain-containing protein [Anaerolineaceae bacterium]
MLVLYKPAAAQSAGLVRIGSPDITKFPAISFYLDAYDGQGGYINDLKANEIQVVENGIPRRADSLILQHPGVQFTVAINFSPSQVNNTSATSPTFIQLLQKKLVDWAKALPNPDMDDISLASNTELQLTHLSNPADWITALQAFKPDLTKVQPSLTELSQALDLATDPDPRPQMKRAILFITPMLTPALAATLPNLTDRASQLGVHVYIWLLSNDIKSDPKLVNPLQQMANRTAGQLIVLAGSDALPDPDDYLNSMRSIYQVSYTSEITQGGAQKLSVNVQGAKIQSASQEKSFIINILAPNPMFLAPPNKIQLSWNQADDKSLPVLTPQSVTIPILVEFPDNHVRPLKESRLFVDGVLESENTAAPFDKFTWKLDKYALNPQTAQTSQHVLKVEIVDSLGLKQDSIDTPVELVIQPMPSSGLLKRVISNKWFPIAAGVLGTVGVTGLAGLAVRRRLITARDKPNKAPGIKITPGKTANIRSESEKAHLKTATMSPTRPIAATISAPAQLVRISDKGNSLPDQTLPITQLEVTLGSDPRQASCVIDLPSVNRLHARLFQNPENNYFLADCGSVAGTWVNYVLVADEGVRLEHGDLIQIGRAAFRFELSHPAQIRQPCVMEYKEESL